jgi:hypothetical protein
MTLLVITEMELTALYIVGAIICVIIFYYLIQGAVKSGTKDIVEELRKQSNRKDPVS